MSGFGCLSMVIGGFWWLRVFFVDDGWLRGGFGWFWAGYGWFWVVIRNYWWLLVVKGVFC